MIQEFIRVTIMTLRIGILRKLDNKITNHNWVNFLHSRDDILIARLILLMVQKSCKPVEVGSLSHSLQGFSTIPGGDRRISAINSIETTGVQHIQIMCQFKGCNTMVFFFHPSEPKQILPLYPIVANQPTPPMVNKPLV